MLPTVNGGTDPLDVRLDAVRAGVSRTRRHWPQRRLALGLSPMPGPALVLLLVGAALGPHGIGVLSAAALGALDPAISVAIAAIGVLIGLEMSRERVGGGRLLMAASLESAITIALVAGGMAALYFQSITPTPTPWVLAMLLGVCAGPSATAAGEDEAAAARLGDLDDILPILLATTAVAWSRPEPAPILIGFVVQGAGVAIVIALATWLLVGQTSSESEQRVFLAGALLLLGGAAAHLSIPALLVGFLAGLFWTLVDGPAREPLARDVRYLQHPLVVLLLVIAGARLELSVDLAALGIAYLVLRMAGKLAGGAAAASVARDLPRDIGLALTAPGVAGIAIAVDVLQANPHSDSAATLFAIVVIGSLGCELLSFATARKGATT